MAVLIAEHAVAATDNHDGKRIAGFLDGSGANRGLAWLRLDGFRRSVVRKGFDNLTVRRREVDGESERSQDWVRRGSRVDEAVEHQQVPPR